MEEFRKLKEQWAATANKKTKSKENTVLKDKYSAEVQRIGNEIAHLNLNLQKLKDSLKDKDDHLQLIQNNITLKEYEQDFEKLKTDHDKLSQAMKEYSENESIFLYL